MRISLQHVCLVGCEKDFATVVSVEGWGFGA